MALDGTGHGLVLRPGVRASIREYRPAVWLVLQDVALEADWRDDRLVASTSARLVAEHLHLDPGTVAGSTATIAAPRPSPAPITRDGSRRASGVAVGEPVR